MGNKWTVLEWSADMSNWGITYWDIYKAQALWWWRHGADRKLTQPKSPIHQINTCVIFGFEMKNSKFSGTRLIRRKK